MLFNAHARILSDIYQKKQSGTPYSIKTKHIKRYQKAGITHAIFIGHTNPYTDRMEAFDEMFDTSIEELKRYHQYLRICYCLADLHKAHENNQLGILLGISGLKHLHDIEHLHSLYHRGLRHVSLTFGELNQYAAGYNDGFRGLSERGIEIIKAIEQLGILLDLTHCNYQTYIDIMKYANKPVIISHGNCKALSNRLRNFSDDQLLMLKKNGGVIGISADPFLISEHKSKQCIFEMAKHIDHVVKLIGIDHVGLGLDITTDDFKSSKLRGFERLEKVNKLLAILVEMGYEPSDLKKIKTDNFNRVIKEILG